MTSGCSGESNASLLTNEQLVTGCIQGNAQCQRILFRKYRTTVLNIIAHSLGAGFDRDDILLQVFIKIFSSLENFQGLSSLETWICRITSKVCIDQLRKKYRKRKIPLIYNTEWVERENNEYSNNSAQEHEKKELISHIYAGLNTLSIEKRMVVTLFELEGFSLLEIADILEKPIGTVKSRLFHGRRELAQYLKSYMDSANE